MKRLDCVGTWIRLSSFSALLVEKLSAREATTGTFLHQCTVYICTYAPNFQLLAEISVDGNGNVIELCFAV